MPDMTEKRKLDRPASSQDAEDSHDESGDHQHEHGGLFGANTEMIFALLCGVDFKIVAAGGAAAGTGRRAFVVKTFVAAVSETDETDAGGFIGIA